MQEIKIDHNERERRLVRALVAALEDAGRTWDDDVSDILDEYPDETRDLPIRWDESAEPEGWVPPILGTPAPEIEYVDARDCGVLTNAQLYSGTWSGAPGFSVQFPVNPRKNVLSTSSRKSRLLRKRRGCLVSVKLP